MTQPDPHAVLTTLAGDPKLRAFAGASGIAAIPAKQSRRLLLLDVIAQAFEPGVRYSEQTVSEFLAALHPDYAALRRYLVDADLLSREQGEYWRSGGTVRMPEPG